MIKKLLSKENIKEFIRFVICGGVATLVDFIVFGLTIYLISPESYNHSLIESIIADRELVPTASVLWGTSIGFTVGLIVNYFISVVYVFRYSEKGKTVKGAVFFIILSLSGLLLNIILMKLGYDIIGLNHWISKIFVTGIVFVYNYLSKRLLIFRSKGNS